MHLLNDIAPEVYRAYFPQSLAATEAVSLEATDAGCEHNYKKWPPSELSNFFPRDKICADDPYWDQAENSPPSLAARCIQTLARFFSMKPEFGCALSGGDRARFLSIVYIFTHFKIRKESTYRVFQLDLMDFKELITIHIWYIYDIVMYFQFPT